MRKSWVSHESGEQTHLYQVTHLLCLSPVLLRMLRPDWPLQSVLVPRPGPGKDSQGCESRWTWRRWCGRRSPWGWSGQRTCLEDRTEGFDYQHRPHQRFRRLLSMTEDFPNFKQSYTDLKTAHRPFSSSVTTHSSRAPEGLWTFAVNLPCAPLRRTAKDAGWFTFRPDSYRGRHTVTVQGWTVLQKEIKYSKISKHTYTRTHARTHTYTHAHTNPPISIRMRCYKQNTYFTVSILIYYLIWSISTISLPDFISLSSSLTCAHVGAAQQTEAGGHRVKKPHC